nr:spenito [Cucujiformia]
TGNAFAFVRFSTLDMSHRAKVELSGQYIGKFQCKIGYGKATPTTRIWVGGLGSWTSVPQLESEFDRFGAIKKIDYVKGESQAFILYDSIDAAQAAVKGMRGSDMGGLEHRLRTDFADVTPGVGFRPKKAYPHDDAPDRRGGGYEDYKYRSRGVYPERSGGSRSRYDGTPDEWGRTRPDTFERRRSGSRGGDRSRSGSPRRSPDSDSDSGSRRAGLLASSRTLPEVARKCTTVWQGALILKNSLFPAKFHLMDGDTDIIEGLMKDEDSKHQLRITQRLRLDPPKLDDVYEDYKYRSRGVYPERSGGSRSRYDGTPDEWGRTRPDTFERRRSGSRGGDRSRSGSP